MAEIDALRTEATGAVEYLRRARARHANSWIIAELEHALDARRAEVDAALREWWAQGCREVAP